MAGRIGLVDLLTSPEGKDKLKVCPCVQAVVFVVCGNEPLGSDHNHYTTVKATLRTLLLCEYLILVELANCPIFAKNCTS